MLKIKCQHLPLRVKTFRQTKTYWIFRAFKNFANNFSAFYFHAFARQSASISRRHHHLRIRPKLPAGCKYWYVVGPTTTLFALYPEV